MCPAFLYDSSSGAKTSHWKARYELHHGERGELGELASLKTPALCGPACPPTPETPAGKWAPCWDTEVPSQSDARPLPVLETLAGPLEDCSMCAEAGTEAILKIRRVEVINEYEMSFFGQGLTVCFCQLGLGSPQANSLQRTLEKSWHLHGGQALLSGSPTLEKR